MQVSLFSRGHTRKGASTYPFNDLEKVGNEALSGAFVSQTEGTIMKISDIRTRIESGVDDQGFLAKTDELEKTPVLTLVDSAERSDACDPLIQALVGKLPKPNTIWPMGDRAKWLQAAAMAFNLVYKPDEGDEHDLKIEKSDLKSAG